MEMHRDIYDKIYFFHDKPKEFLVYCVPMLKEMTFQPDMYIYQEGDAIQYVYFIEKGRAGFVLPRFDNAIYIIIEHGDLFGVIDLVPMSEKKGKFSYENKRKTVLESKRKFTV